MKEITTEEVEQLLDAGQSVVVLDDLSRGHRAAVDPRERVPFGSHRERVPFGTAYWLERRGVTGRGSCARGRAGGRGGGAAGQAAPAAGAWRRGRPSARRWQQQRGGRIWRWIS